MLRLLGIAALVSAGLAAPARADSRWSLKLESGAEYDTNIHRFPESDDPEQPVEASPLTRLGARYRLRVQPGDGHLFRFDGYAGAKLFTTESGQSENVTILQGDLAYTRGFESRRAALGARASFYDASGYDLFEAPGDIEPRAFTTLLAEGTFTLAGPEEHRLTASAGVRSFEYDPRPGFDWIGDRYGLTYRTTLWRGDPDQEVDAASVDLRAGYRLERRDYDANAFTDSCPEGAPADERCFTPTPLSRADLHHTGSAEAVYTGERIYSARYEIRVNDSNSYGHSLVRQRLELKLTTEIAESGFYATATGAVLLNLFLDPLLLARDVQSQTFVSIDDENRNSFSLHLSRDPGRRPPPPRTGSARR